MTNSFLAKKAAKILKANHVKAERYLDLGCGSGESSTIISAVVCAQEIVGVDIVEDNIQRLPKFIKGYRFDLENLDRERLPFSSEHFDLVTAIEVIEHLTYCDDLLTEAYRVLKPKGYFLLTTPNLASWINRSLLLFGYQPMFMEPSRHHWVGFPKWRSRPRKVFSSYGHKNLLTFKALMESLKMNGLSPIKVTGSPLHKQEAFFRMIDYLLSRKASFAPILIVLAKKA